MFRGALLSLILLPLPRSLLRFSGAPAFWDAGSHPASQRRTSSVVMGLVAGSSVTTLLMRATASF